MRNLLTPGLIILSVLLLGTLPSCIEDKCELTQTYQVWNAVYKQVDEIRQDVKMERPRELKTPGKIYFYQDMIFINEFREGIHVIDNQDPSAPNAIAFISIPGNVDMAIIGNLLYADNYIDLITINIEQPTNPQFVSRTENVFLSYSLHQDLGHLVYYEESQLTQEVSCTSPRWGSPFWFDNDVLMVEFNGAFDAVNSSGTAASSGIGGSLARFTLAEGHLYVVDEFSLRVFDLSNQTQPEMVNEVNLGWGIETIFPYNKNLFIGSNSGMFIFDNSTPTEPTLLSVFQHANACDPVYVDGDLAYVTLRDGTECQEFTNQLDVVNIENLEAPYLLKTYPMHHPHGLSISEDHLYLCEGDEGLKVFDKSDWTTIDQNLKFHQKGFTSYDVITLGGKKLAMVIGQDGLYQFDITDPSNLVELSVMPVTK